MAVDRNRIVTLHKKVRVILAARKSSIFAVKLFGRRFKSSRKLVKHAIDQARAENEQSERSVWWNIRGKNWEGILVVLLEKWLQKQDSVKLQWVESSKNTSEPILTKCRKGMNFHPLMNVQYETSQMSTHSESHERQHGAQFGVHWWEEIWRSAMPKPPKWSSLE